MAYLPLPDIELTGTTVGSGAGETIELLPYLILKDNTAFTIEVRAVVNGTVNPYARLVRSFIQRYTVTRTGGVTVVESSDTPDVFGDSGGSSWTLTVSAGTSPDRLQITFSTGSTQAIVTVTADVFIVPSELAWLSIIPSGPVEAQRADLGVTLNAGNVSNWADQSTFHTDLLQSTPSFQPVWTASDPLFNNQPSIGGLSTTGTLASGVLSLSSTVGWTMAAVYRMPSNGGSVVWTLNNGGISIGATATPNYAWAYSGSYISSVVVVTNPGIVVATFDAGGAVNLYVNGTTVRATGTGTTPMSVTSSADPSLGANNGYMAEQVLWPRVLNGTEISRYMNYASSRYKITLF